MLSKTIVENSLGSAARLLSNSEYAAEAETFINTFVHIAIKSRMEGLLALLELLEPETFAGPQPLDKQIILPLPPLADLLLNMIVDGNDWNAIESIGANYVMQTSDDESRYMGVLTIEGTRCVQEGASPYVAAKRLLSCTTLGDEAAAGIMADVKCGKTSMEIVKGMLESLQEKGECCDMMLTDAFVENALQEAAAVLASDEKKADELLENIRSMVLMAVNVRRNGIMSLESFSKTVPCCDVLQEGVQMAFEGFSQEDIQAILAHKTAVKTDAVKRLLGIMAIDALTHIVANENPRWKSMRLLSLFPAVTYGLRDKYNAIKAKFIDI